MSTEQRTLDGNEPSWYNDDTNCDHYTTNFGGVEIHKETGDMLECCIGLGRNQYNVHMQIKIFNEEFQIAKDNFGSIYAELCSPNFPYKRNPKQTIELSEVLIMLQKDDNFSIAAIAVKKELVRLMIKHLHFSKQDRYELHKLLGIWRKPITKEDLEEKPKRTPIITRTPILR